jgi:integrase
MATVRAEFRDEVLVFAADDPIFGAGVCRVPACDRSATGGYGLCQGHHLRWKTAGRPEVNTFAAATDPRWRLQRPNMVCRVDGCRYGSSRAGMCVTHAQRWHRAGRPDPDGWVASASPAKPSAVGVVCGVPHCDLWPEAAGPFCHSHTATWRANGRPDVEEFIARFTAGVVPADQVVRLDALPPQLRLEIAYALQCRRDERATKTAPAVVMAVVRFLADVGEHSLLDRTEHDWRTSIGRPAPADSNPRALLVYARRRVEDLAHADGWDGEYARDVWQLRRLGFDGNHTLRFDVIGQPWLRALAKRWVRWRMGTGLVLETVRRGLRVLTRFADFCDRIGVTQLADLDRQVLERYLADLHAEMAGRSQHGVHIGQLNSFLTTIRLQGWDSSLPATALLFSTDNPTRAERPPRALAEQVMTQVEHRDNLTRFTDPAHRLVTVILIRCGLRVSDALRLRHDCIVLDADGAPYLRYLNHKMKREALVPIDEELREAITEQQARAGQAPVLFPRPTKNPDSRHPIASTTYRAALYRWLAACDIRDEHDRPVRLTPHQWRHTLGTRLINKDVPQEVVRRILDHDSPQMTAHYARLHDSTVRRHWEAARKIDARGETVTLDPDGPLAEAAWAKQRLSRATQALPNGYCGLPVQKSCPHANACLTCPMFITTGEFLPQHRQHRNEVHQIISAAETRGQSRLVEMNRQVADNLDKIITALEDDTDEPHGALDVG